MGVATTADNRKWGVGAILQEQPAYEELTNLKEKLEGILYPEIWGSEEYKTRVKKDIRKIDNFIDHLQKMRNRY